MDMLSEQVGEQVGDQDNDDGGRWYTPTCATPGVTARGHSISISISAQNLFIQ